MKTALYIGRFQPFHNGHLDAANQIVENGYDKVIIGIGSCGESRTKNNPLSLYERSNLIKSAFKKLNLNYEILPIPDFGDNCLWTNYITRTCEFDTVFTGNNWTQNCFEEYSDKEVRKLKNRIDICATDVREEIVKQENWQENVPQIIAKNIVNQGLEKAILESCRPELKTPYLAVDGIIELDDGIVLIERKNEPLGYSLPGGFVDIDEDCITALRREMKEEISLNIDNIKLFGEYSNPKRDPRQHVASLVYTAKANNIPEANDDAKKAFIVPFEKLSQYNLVFDHAQIVDDYLKDKQLKSATILQKNVQ